MKIFTSYKFTLEEKIRDRYPGVLRCVRFFHTTCTIIVPHGEMSFEILSVRWLNKLKRAADIIIHAPNYDARAAPRPFVYYARTHAIIYLNARSMTILYCGHLIKRHGSWELFWRTYSWQHRQITSRFAQCIANACSRSCAVRSYDFDIDLISIMQIKEREINTILYWHCVRYVITLRYRNIS